MMWGNNRGSHIACYVRHKDIPDYERMGWLWTPALVDTHHGEFADLMVWVCDCMCPMLPGRDQGRL
jgi:hypothetical protein